MDARALRRGQSRWAITFGRKEIGIAKQRAEQLEQRCRKLLGMGERISRAEVWQLAGLASWMAGLMPQLNAFTRRLWAAIHASSEFTIPLRQVRTPLRWFAALADETYGPLERRCRRRAKHSVLITFDGSLSGGGATLQLVSPSSTTRIARNMSRFGPRN